MENLAVARYEPSRGPAVAERSKVATDRLAAFEQWGGAPRRGRTVGAGGANPRCEVGADRMPTHARLPPLCDAILGMVNAGELFEGRQYQVPLRGHAGDVTLTLSIADATQPKAPPQQLHSGGLQPRQLRRVFDHIRANISETIPLAALAAIACLSTSHFSRAFKTSVGETPHAHILRLRIEAAMQMMMQTDEPLAQIALTCGLADQAHLSRRFRLMVGTSPSRWRRRHRA